jgi:Zn-dependent protease/predicted transcriptional regulator
MRPDPSNKVFPHSGFSVGRFRGVQIRVDWSLLIVFALIVLNLASGVFPAWHPAWSAAQAWGAAALAAVLFVLSIMAHELAHVWVARRYGITVKQVTLFLFGGVAHLETEPTGPRAEFLMAIIGPLVSVALGFLATALGMQLIGAAFTGMPSTSDDRYVREMLAQMGPVTTLLLWLGPVNLFLGILNLIPGYPLDGGRVLRAFLWWASGDLAKATRWAKLAGRVCAWVMIALGLTQILAGMLGQGVWLLLIGWFLNSAARLNGRPAGAHQQLHDVPVSRVMWVQSEHVTPEVTVDRFVHDHMVSDESLTLAVESDGSLVGMVSLDDVLRVPQDEWARARVKDIMTPLAELATLPVDADAERALDVLASQGMAEVPIVEGRRLRGLVRRRDLVRWLAQQGEPAYAA